MKHLTGDDEQYDAMIACGLEALNDLFGLVELTLETIEEPGGTATRRARLRDRHPAWFAPTSLHPMVAEVLNRA